MTRQLKSGIYLHRYQNNDLSREDKIHAPHRDTHALFNFAEQGSGRFLVDFKMHQLTAPVIVMVFPGQVHYIEACKNVTGWSIAFDPTLMGQELSQRLEQIFKSPLSIQKEGNLYKQLLTMLQLLQQFSESATTTEQSAAMQGLFVSMLQWLAGTLRARCAASHPASDRAKEIELGFKALLQRHFMEHKRPGFYSAQLRISTAHLGDTIKSLTGKSITTHIQEISLLEAKRHLYNTSLSVKEICFLVGYDDPVHFGKLFKKHCGLTPLAFRKKIRE